MSTPPINPLNGRSDIDLALRFRRAIATAEIRDRTEFGTEMVFSYDELQALEYAMAKHVQQEHKVNARTLREAYEQAYGNDKDLLRTVYHEPILDDPRLNGNGNNS